MTDEQLSFAHAIAIEKLADTMREVGTPMPPEILFAFLRFRTPDIDMIRVFMDRAWNNGFREGSERHAAPDRPHALPNRN